VRDFFAPNFVRRQLSCTFRRYASITALQLAYTQHGWRNSGAAVSISAMPREEQRNKLEQMASLENRSVSNLIEVLADERWKRLAEQQGIAYAKTVAEAMNLNLDMDNPADREKLRRAILDLVAGRKCQSKNGLVEILSFSDAAGNVIETHEHTGDFKEP